MPTARLSSKLIENLRPPAEGRSDYWDSTISEDTSLPGSFGLRVSASGVKSWQIMYRAPQRDGMLQQKRMVLGNYPAFGLSEAREMGREALKKVARGIDPAVDRKVSRAKTAAIPTVAEAAAEFIERSKGWSSWGILAARGKCASAKASATWLKAVAECPGCRSIPRGVQQA